jgi:hypothetical protein
LVACQPDRYVLVDDCHAIACEVRSDMRVPVAAAAMPQQPSGEALRDLDCDKASWLRTQSSI